ncbi:helix-turn-helix transcriptional regulator [Oricola nitratireducens]|uniref:helix-turn-helix transcriptional regulator n=1 Tax=Oricola nitratireducens TaxID=2775868 RepID=UPI001866C544|nr:AlpA family transcriptional regulator [Oricola nitratireducens]
MHQFTPELKPDRLLRLDEVMALTGMCRSRIYEQIANGENLFPKPVKIGRASRWPLSEVVDWIEQQKARRKAAA